jgi:hypothetical protein
MRLSLNADGSRLAVGKAAAIDLASFRVVPPQAANAPRTEHRTWPWAFALGLVALVAAWLVTRRRGGLRPARLANALRRT